MANVSVCCVQAYGEGACVRVYCVLVCVLCVLCACVCVCIVCLCVCVVRAGMWQVCVCVC